MRCEQALERMLVADPGALRGDAAADAELAAHLAGCRRCRAVAATLTSELAALDAGLEELASRRELPVGAPARHRRRRLPRGTWVPLAAAAALAALLVIGRGGGPELERPGSGGEPPWPGSGEPRVAVTVPVDRGAAVMATRNPKITVVWLYERSER